MKKVDKSLTRYFKTLTIYLDDLETVVEHFDEVGFDVSLTTDEYEYESVAELVEHHEKGEMLDNLKVEAVSSDRSFLPVVRLDLSRHLRMLRASSSRIEVRGVFSAIEATLKSCESKLTWLINNWLSAGLFLAVLLLLLWAKPTAVEQGLVVAVWFLYLGWSTYRRRRATRILLIKRSERLGLIRRNLDHLVIALLAAVVGAVVGVLVGRIFP